MLPMPAVVPVHEEVQQRTREKQEERQQSEGMGAVLGRQEEGCDQQEADRGQPCF